MQNFFDSDLVWDEGMAWPHVYLTPRLDAWPKLNQLVRQARGVLADGYVDCVAPVDDDWLHWTVARTADPHIDRHELVDRVRAATMGLPAFDLRVGSVVSITAVVLAATDDIDNGFADVRRACTDAIGDVWGSDKPATPPHLSIGYGIADGDNEDQLSTQLWLACQPPHALARIDTITVADVYCDKARGRFQWDTLACFPLA